MFPQFYQNIFETYLSLGQLLTLQAMILLLQKHRNVTLAHLATVFPQPIQKESRIRSLQRFLYLPQLSIKLLWFPIVKHVLEQERRKQPANRAQRRRAKKKGILHQGYLLVAIDRTQWKDNNIILLSVIWGNHAIPVFWDKLPKKGSSSFAQQKRVIAPVLDLLRDYPIVFLGDREFHSVKLAQWLSERGVEFALRQKKSTCIQDDEQVYVALEDLNIQRGMSRFYKNIRCTKTHQLGNFNLAAYWKGTCRGKKTKEPWYILTSLPSAKLALSLYAARWGIETLFKDCKTGGYNLENTRVNQKRLLAIILLIAIAYTLATLQGQVLKDLGISKYICRSTEEERTYERHSDFWVGLYGPLWLQSFKDFFELATLLMKLKPHKRLYFQRGLKALSLIESTV